ncbi:putative glycoside hydrolase [Edaphobacter sp. 12200R-103]|uniref:putative glycoside hydrolase n=1 Tax=Edaphobacter sp. 12200R-103 TaxID=2703788 RepID=UPI00192E8857
MILKHHAPVTLFIYPSAISNASYALTWEDSPDEKVWLGGCASLKALRRRYVFRRSIDSSEARARFRSWLQAFRNYAFDRRTYGPAEVSEQIRATEDFGSSGWMLLESA